MPNKWILKQQELEAQEARRIVEYEETQTFDDATYKSQFKPPEFKPGDPYVWQKDDDLNGIARRMNVKLKVLMQYNEIDDYHELEPGVTIYTPVIKSKPRRPIRYEILPEPREMHVAKEDGAKKWSFGNVKTWDDFKPFGHYPQGTRVSIVAVAHVPVDDPDSPTAEAGYYLDSLAVGDYANTGAVRYTVGYAWTDLSNGHLEVEEEPVDKEEPTKVMDIADTPAPAPTKPNHYKTTYQWQKQPIECIANLPGTLDFLWIKEFDEKRPNRKLYQHQEVDIAGVFEVDGSFYGRPTASSKAGYWFGIPMEVLQRQEDLYNANVDAPTRAAMGSSLSWSERLIDVPLAKIIYNPRYRWLQRFKTKNNKE